MGIVDEPRLGHLLDALAAYQQDPEGGIRQVERQATDRDPVARGVLAWMLAQQGRLADGIPHALEAARAGAGQLATVYAQNLAASADPSQRDAAGEFFRLAQQFPSVIDPFAQAVAALQQGNRPLAEELLRDSVTAPLAGIREQADRLVQDADHRLRAIGETEARATAEADHAIAQIRESLEQVRREQEDLSSVARQAGALASGTSATVQARDYSERANRVERRAERLTLLSVVLAVGIAAGAIALAASGGGDTGVDDAARRAAFALPLVFVNLYLARLAGSFREEAIRWRHIELQMKSAIPFLGGMAPDRREDVLAALAAGFFPGQPMPGDHSDAAPPDIAAVLTAALDQSRSRATTTGQDAKPAPA